MMTLVSLGSVITTAAVLNANEPQAPHSHPDAGYIDQSGKVVKEEEEEAPWIVVTPARVLLDLALLVCCLCVGRSCIIITR
jgi:hypothetical protein